MGTELTLTGIVVDSITPNDTIVIEEPKDRAEYHSTVDYHNYKEQLTVAVERLYSQHGCNIVVVPKGTKITTINQKED